MEMLIWEKKRKARSAVVQMELPARLAAEAEVRNDPAQRGVVRGFASSLCNPKAILSDLDYFGCGGWI